MSDSDLNLELDIERGVEALNKALQNETFVERCMEVLSRYADDPENFLAYPVKISGEAIVVYDALRRTNLENMVTLIINKTQCPCPPCTLNPDGTERGQWKPFEILLLENCDVLD